MNGSSLARPVSPARSHLLRLGLSALVVPVLVAAGPGAPAHAQTQDQRARTGAGHSIQLDGWSSDAELGLGSLKGAEVRNGSVRFSRAAKQVKFRGTRHELARWVSPWTSTSFAFTDLVPSWQARTPGRSLVKVRVRGRAADGTLSSWDNVAVWAAKDTAVKRSSGPAQTDDLARLDTDTWKTTSSAGLTAYQVRVELLRPVGTRSTPRIDRVSAVASRLSAATSVPVSAPGTVGTVLPVPSYSQMVHRGHYPGWGGGGAAWCSPTSVSMVLGYRGALPGAKLTAWARSSHVDSVVDHAARSSYDYRYAGAGNWAFNIAYAGVRNREAWVTRFNSLTELEPLVNQGTPVVVSVRFGRGELSGAPISSTAGHLMVVVGFDSAGNVVVNDPAASSNAGVRRTYDRAQFENVWTPASPSGSGGLAYVIN